MRIFPPRLTDEDYVERVRRGLVSSERWRPWVIALTTLFVLLICIFGEGVLNRAVKFGAIQGQNAGPVVGGFITGLFFGAAIGGFCYEAVRLWLDALFGDRARRLLIRYYDAARDVSCDGTRSNEAIRSAAELIPAVGSRSDGDGEF